MAITLPAYPGKEGTRIDTLLFQSSLSDREGKHAKTCIRTERDPLNSCYVLPRVPLCSWSPSPLASCVSPNGSLRALGNAKGSGIVSSEDIEKNLLSGYLG